MMGTKVEPISFSNNSNPGSTHQTPVHSRRPSFSPSTNQNSSPNPSNPNPTSTSPPSTKRDPSPTRAATFQASSEPPPPTSPLSRMSQGFARRISRSSLSAEDRYLDGSGLPPPRGGLLPVTRAERERDKMMRQLSHLGYQTSAGQADNGRMVEVESFAENTTSIAGLNEALQSLQQSNTEEISASPPDYPASSLSSSPPPLPPPSNSGGGGKFSSLRKLSGGSLGASRKISLPSLRSGSGDRNAAPSSAEMNPTSSSSTSTSIPNNNRRRSSSTLLAALSNSNNKQGNNSNGNNNQTNGINKQISSQPSPLQQNNPTLFTNPFATASTPPLNTSDYSGQISNTISNQNSNNNNSNPSSPITRSSTNSITNHSSLQPNSPTTPSSINSRPSTRVSFDFASANEARLSHSRRPSASLVSLPLPTVQSTSQSQQQSISAQMFPEDEEMDGQQANRDQMESIATDTSSSKQSTSRGLRETMRGLASQSSEILGLRRSTDVRPELGEISGTRSSIDNRRQRFSGFLKSSRDDQGQMEELSSQPSSSIPATPSRLSFSAFRSSRASGEAPRRSRTNSNADRPLSQVGPSDPRRSEDPGRRPSGDELEGTQSQPRKRKVSGFLKKVGIGGGKKEKDQRSGGSPHFQNSPPLPQSPAHTQLANGSSRSEEVDSEGELARNPDAAFEKAFGKPTQGTLRSPSSSASLNANERDITRHSRNSSNSSGLRHEVTPFPAPRAVTQLQAAESSNRQSVVSADGTSFHSATSSPATSMLALGNNEGSSNRSGLPTSSSSSRPFEWVDSFGIASTGRPSGLGLAASSPSESDHTNSSRSTSGGVHTLSQGRTSDLVAENSTPNNKGKERENQVPTRSSEDGRGLKPPTSDDRRRSLGLDEEQDQNEGNATLSTASTTKPPVTSSSSTPATDSSSNAPPSRPNRSVAGLSHMPRLNSMRGTSGGGQGGGSSGGNRNNGESSGGAGGGRRDEDDDQGHDSGGGAGDDSEEEVTDDDDEDDDHHADDSRATMDDMETDTEGEEEEAERQRARARVAASMPMPGGFTGFGLVASPSTSLANSQELPAVGTPNGIRARPDEITLPPRPSFTPQSPPDTSNRITPGPFSTPSVAVGKQAWTSFNATPFESPFETPRASNGINPEPSYFSHQPAPARNVGNMTQVGGDGPPPSPSVITRSRAPSSASGRSFGQPPSRSMTTPGREIPSMPPATLEGLDFSNKDKMRSIAGPSPASGVDGGATSMNRSKSSRQDSGPRNRPSTAGDALPSAAMQFTQDQNGVPPVPSITAKNVEGSSLFESRQQANQNQPPLASAFGFNKSSSGSDRPGLYHHKSKSLIDLSSERLHDGAHFSPAGFGKNRNQGSLLPGISIGQQDGSKAGDKGGRQLLNENYGEPPPTPMSPSLRRRSMIELRVEPPPYTVIHRRPEGPQVIYPREEEGKEKLPLYNCSVHIEGYLPRKMEFSAPGVQAKDRSWKRQYIVLHGTCLRVYKTDAIAGLAAQGAWGNMKGVHVHLEPMNEDGPGSTSSVVPGQSPFVSQSNQGHQHNSSNASNANNVNATAEKSGTHSGPRLAAAKEVLTGVAHAPLSFAHASHSKDPATSAAVSAEARTHHGIVRNYTLQSAESGLAADYLKRRHVVRVRAEGEQFLLHTRSDRHVVDWIEALQAATNVSMDLEKRQMPKFITLPRRRRRRRRNADGSTGPLSPAEAEQRDLAEAQRRSLADTMGGGPTSRRDRSNRSNDDNPIERIRSTFG